jgi:hypothetical protein
VRDGGHDGAGFVAVAHPRDTRRLEARDVDRLAPQRRQHAPLAQKVLGPLQYLQHPAPQLGAIALAHRLRAPLPVNRAAVRAIHEALAGHQQSQVELMFLRARLIGFPAANVDDRLLAPQRPAGLREIPTCEQDPAVVRLRNRQRLASRCRSDTMLQNHWTEHDVGIEGIGGDPVPLVANLVNQQVIVSIEVLQPCAARHIQQLIAGHVPAAIRTGLSAHARSKAADDLKAAIGRAIVDNHHFDLGSRLRQRTLDRLANPALGVETRNQYRDHEGLGTASGRRRQNEVTACSGNPSR